MQNLLEIVDDKFNVVLCDEQIAEKIALGKVLCEILFLKKEKVKIINYKYEDKDFDIFIASFKKKNKILWGDFLDKLEIIKDFTKDFNEIVLEEKSNLVIIGGERFCEIKQKAIPYTENHLRDSVIRLFGMESLNVSKKIMDSWHIFKDKDFLLSVTMFFEVSGKKAKEILSEYESDEFISITSLLTEKEEVDIQQILIELNNKPLNESLKYISEELSDNLSEVNLSLLKFICYLQNGYLEESLTILKDIFEVLEDDKIIVFCNILISQEKYQEAFNLIKPIYEKNKWLTGLFPALIKSSIILGTTERENLIEEILVLDNKELFLLQEAGNFFWKVKNYKRAGELYRKIFNLSDNRYFDMLARISELMFNVPENVNDAESYLHALLDIDPDTDELNNEIYYRTALICENTFNSNYKYYQNLKKININDDFYFSKDVINRRLDILKDEMKTIGYLKVKVDKQSNKIVDRDIRRIRETRLNEILNGIEYLFLDDQGYINIQEFVDYSQSEEAWNKSISIYLNNEIESWKMQSIENIKDSLVPDELEDENDEITFEQLFNIVRRLREMEDSNEEKLKIIKGVMIRAMDFNDILKESYIRFQVGLFLTYIGEHQQANGHALTLLNRYNREKNKLIKSKLLILGLSIWAASQYRSGRKVDAILCSIVVMRKSLEMNEYYTIESSSNILYLYLVNDLKMENSKDIKLKLADFKTSLVSQLKKDIQMSSPVEIENALLNEDWNKSEMLLKDQLNDFSLKDVNDATNLVNYTNTLCMLGKDKQAYSLVLEKFQEVIKLFEMRLDNRWKVCYHFAQVIYKEIYNERFNENSDSLMAIIQIAISDIDKQRKGLFHIQERAAYTEETQHVYKLFLEIATLMDMINRKNGQKQGMWHEKIIELLFKTSSVSLLEKKVTDTTVTEEAEEIVGEYFKLYEELLNIKVDIESVEYRQKTKRFEYLQEFLIKEHYSFRSLIQMEEMDLILLQSLLRESEVFYEYRIIKNIIISLLVTKESSKLEVKILEFEFVNGMNEVLNSLGLDLSLGEDRKSERLEEIELLCEVFSEIIFGEVIEYADNSSARIDLIVCPDMSLPYFTPSLMRNADGWVINKINKINNILSANELKYRDKKDTSNHNDFLISIGSKASGKDKSIPIAEEWYKHNKDFFIDRIENIQEVSYINNEKQLFLILIAHGIEESEKIAGTAGAIRILGSKKQYIDNDVFSEITHKVNVLFLLTCQSGQPSINNIQKAETVWKTIVSQNCSSILCRWDVGIEPGLKVLEYYRDFNGAFKDNSQILISAQKSLLASTEYNIPSEWACFEFWGLE